MSKFTAGTIMCQTSGLTAASGGQSRSVDKLFAWHSSKYHQVTGLRPVQRGQCINDDLRCGNMQLLLRSVPYMDLMQLYYGLPPTVRNWAIGAYGGWQAHRRFSGEFSAWHEYLLESQYLDREEIMTSQVQALRDLLSHAYATVPYYTSIFDRYGSGQMRLQVWRTCMGCQLSVGKM